MPHDNQHRVVTYAGIGVALGAGVGLITGVLLGGSAIALGLAFGAGTGVVIGAGLDAARRRRPG